MQTLSFEEISVVSGGEDIPTVVVTGTRMTDEEKYAYDMGQAWTFGQMAYYTGNYMMDQLFGWEYH